MRLHAIINARAGSLVGVDATATLALVSEAFTGRGHALTAELVEPSAIEAAIARQATAPLDALLVGGGDGTARSAATLLAGTTLPLTLLPLGTLNRLARDLAIPLEPRSAAEALADGRISAIDIATVNGRTFLCNAMVGITTRFSEERQRLRGKPRAERLRGYLQALRAMLNGRRRMLLGLDDGSGEKLLRAISLVVANNAYADDGSLALRRETLSGGELAAYVARHSSGWAAARGLLLTLIGRRDDDPNIVRLRCRDLVVDVKHRHLAAVSIDGEIERLETPLRFAVRPSALKVLVPSDSPV